MKSKFKRNIICLAVLLILVLGTTSINGKIFKQTNEKNPITMEYDYDDYVAGYWKFDEGSGDIAYDSSGNEFDGDIYGATWVTGHSSYALDFDGINDYVALDSYSPHLGFNKTDDMIFSFWFKSSSEETGVIYSTSKSDSYNPGVQIALHPNGTIQYKTWVLSCGVNMCTEDSYNDGSWHYVEIWYNGITANPTITIYVDDDEDISITHWICQFSANEFNKDKIGRTSLNQTDYFDGVIDEFKIIKFPGGNKQNHPQITGPDIGEINEELEFTFKVTDPEEDEMQAYIDWGDGTNTGWFGSYQSGDQFTKTHKYSDNGKFEIKAQVEDVWDNGPFAIKWVAIGNQYPDPPAITGPGYAEPNSEIDFSFESDDADEDDLYYWIEWGDGGIEEWIGPYDFDEKIEVPHIWDENGKYTIKAKAKDIFNQESTESTFPIRVGNENPETPSVSGQQLSKLDTDYDYKFVSTDPEGDNLFYYIKWGDGFEDNKGPVASGDEITISHSWHNKGSYTIKAYVVDQLGGKSGEGTLKVTAPKSKGVYFSFNILERILGQYPFAFPILRNLLGL